ncbi:hypothetical protein D3C72_2198640 [compost metagenome]
MLAKPSRIARMPPECLRVLSSRMAPKMIHSTDRVISTPCTVEDRTRLRLMSQANSAISAVTMKTSGIAFLADQLRPISNSAESRIGRKARNACSPMLMIAYSSCVVLIALFPS